MPIKKPVTKAEAQQACRTSPNKLAIFSYVHCGKCLEELPANQSPQDYASNEVGFTAIGLQVFCKRHKCNVLHLDFQGQKHPACVEA